MQQTSIVESFTDSKTGTRRVVRWEHHEFFEDAQQRPYCVMHLAADTHLAGWSEQDGEVVIRLKVVPREMEVGMAECGHCCPKCGMLWSHTPRPGFACQAPEQALCALCEYKQS